MPVISRVASSLSRVASGVKRASSRSGSRKQRTSDASAEEFGFVRGGSHREGALSRLR